MDWILNYGEFKDKYTQENVLAVQPKQKLNTEIAKDKIIFVFNLDLFDEYALKNALDWLTTNTEGIYLVTYYESDKDQRPSILNFYVKKPRVYGRAHISQIYHKKYNYPEFDSNVDIDLNFDKEIYKTYILSIEGNPRSQKQADRCIESLQRFNMDYEMFYGYDGTGEGAVKTPNHLVGKDHMKWVKVLDPSLSKPELCCTLGHVALWAHCITINKPIVILEHDAIMLKAFTRLSNPNSIEYLGHVEDAEKVRSELNLRTEEQAINALSRMQGTAYTPNMQVINRNFLFIRGLHAYAISPIAAKKLFSYVLENGITNAIDVIVRMGMFSMSKNGIFAVQSKTAEADSTISKTTDWSMPCGKRKPFWNVPEVV